MLTNVHGSDSFQVLTSSFSISPSEQGYVLNISANGKDFSPLFTVGAGVTRLVTGMASGSYYKLVGNESDVVVNWVRSCVTEGGSGGSGVTYTAGDYIDITQDVISVTGITPDAYLTSADTEDFATKDYVDEAVAGKADKKTLVDFDHTTQAERAALYTELKTLYDGGSGATINKNYDFYKTVNTWQGLKIDYYGFSGDTLVFGKVVSPENTQDQVVYEQVMTIDSAGTVNVVTNTVGGVDLSAYWNSAQTEDAISAATSGKADAVSITENPARTIFPKWNSQGIITGEYAVANMGDLRVNGTNKQVFFFGTGSRIATFYAPLSAGTAGDILVSTGNGAPVWSAVTMPDMSEYTPTSGFATVNGSAITEGGNIEIQGGGADMSAYWTSAETEEHIASAFTYINEVEQVTASAYTELHDGLMEVSARTVDLSGYYTSAQTEQAITSKNYVTSAQVETQIIGKNYITDQALTAYTPTSGFATVNGSAITNGGNITIQGGGGGGISQADLASSGYLYYDNGSTNLDDNGVADYLNGEAGGKLVNYDHDEGTQATQGAYGNAPYPKHIVSIWQSDYDDMLANHEWDIDSETLYIVLPDPCDEECECQKQGGWWDGIECHTD